jgi:hypothetical protein
MNKRLVFLIILSLVLTTIVGLLFYFNLMKEQEFRISEMNKYEMIQNGVMPNSGSEKMQISNSETMNNMPIENTSELESSLIEVEKVLDIEDLETTE